MLLIVGRFVLGLTGVKRFIYISAADFGVVNYLLQGYYEGKVICSTLYCSDTLGNGSPFAKKLYLKYVQNAEIFLLRTLASESEVLTVRFC
jgi:hypothetical protein